MGHLSSKVFFFLMKRNYGLTHGSHCKNPIGYNAVMLFEGKVIQTSEITCKECKETWDKIKDKV